MTVYLETPLPQLAAELMDVIRVFFGPADFSLEPASNPAEALHHAFTEEAGLWRCAFDWQSHHACGEAPLPRDDDPRRQALLRKRWQKRLCKQTLYDLCRELTGIHPPWGSLTGIRPTRLLYEALQRGETLEAAGEGLIRRYDVTEEKARLLREIVAV